MLFSDSIGFQNVAIFIFGAVGFVAGTFCSVRDVINALQVQRRVAWGVQRGSFTGDRKAISGVVAYRA
jgi:hypothetical protein